MRSPKFPKIPLAATFALLLPLLAIPAQAERSREGLVLLFDFHKPDRANAVLSDRSGAGLTPDLRIEQPKSVAWEDGSLVLKSGAGITSQKPPAALIQTLRKSRDITLETWLKPATESTGEAAPILSLGKGGENAAFGFSIVQEKNRFNVRLHTSSTDSSGRPFLETPAGTAKRRWTHLVYTRETSGTARLYVNGQQRASRKIPGEIEWSDSLPLFLASTPESKEQWLGQLRLVAIYSRILTPKEISNQYAEGALPTDNPSVVAKVSPKPKPEAIPVPQPPISSPPPPNATHLPPITLPGGQKLVEVDFERHVMALLGRQGCNTGACHGALQGESDLQLSLFSYDPVLDFESLTSPDFGPLANADKPESSLLLRKPTQQIKHKGGERLIKGSWQYEVLEHWIRAGATRVPGRGKVTELVVTPKEQRFGHIGQTQPLKVEALFQDGTREDVTPFSSFESRDDYVARVSETGLVEAVRPGDASIVVGYRDLVTSFRALIPRSDGLLTMILKQFQPSSHPAAVNYIDREVFAKLSGLGIEPSALASDEEFLRRLSIDTIGRLPSPSEARSFLADTNASKREAKIDELLSHPLHAALWATKLSDITGNNTALLENPGEKRSKMWYDWLRVRLEKNVPYDEIIGGILLATSREGRPVDDWIRDARSLDQSALQSFATGYPERKTLDLYWTRRGLSLEQMAEQTASAFLGVQLHCAQCHKHPYDQWSQADYRAFANVFGQVKFGASPEAKKAIAAENQDRKKIKEKNQRPGDLKEVYLELKQPQQLKDPATKAALSPKAPGGPAFEKSATDYREALFEWMRSPENPYFARSFVNRVWAHYAGRGIVDPVDNFAAGNPPSNTRLLDALAQDFVANGYDLRRLEREILRSRVYQISSVPTQSNAADERNYSRKIPRPMMAEVVVDVLNSALGAEEEFLKDAPKGSQAVEVAASRVQDGELSYAFRIFGRPQRASACDCERPSEPALPQSLYLMTDQTVMQKIQNGRIKSLLAQDGRGERLSKKDSPDADAELSQLIDELFLGSLTRYPDDSERQKALDAVRQQTTSEAGLRDVLWALVNTREFILNH